MHQGLRLSADVLEVFRKTGPGRQTRIDNALRQGLKAHARAGAVVRALFVSTYRNRETDRFSPCYFLRRVPVRKHKLARGVEPRLRERMKRARNSRGCRDERRPTHEL